MQPEKINDNEQGRPIPIEELSKKMDYEFAIFKEKMSVWYGEQTGENPHGERRYPNTKKAQEPKKSIMDERQDVMASLNTSEPKNEENNFPSQNEREREEILQKSQELTELIQKFFSRK
eukprot:TRINITY_DN14645_c0_g1_i1.p1 TRINITY_DN14645_c0_g1~~TRINITY_DN14645_c0_g1_i1.p1  ORF type:complete len:119 (+),score=15.22 TRINITY_DN14645_c0_g1_i1:124-480(+)